MQLLRILHCDSALWAVDHGDKVVPLRCDASGPAEAFPDMLAKTDIVLLPPCAPRQIVCVALNYRSVAEALNIPLPTEPVFFIKALGSLAGHKDTVLLPETSQDVVEEAELAIVLKHDVFKADEETAGAAIGGFTIANDVTARDIQTRGNSFMWASVSKSFETFFPCGPVLETALTDLPDRRLECRVNGELRQSALLGDMIFRPSELISRLSRVMPLYRGDIIATGTPLGYSAISDGDSVEISIDGMPSLINRVKRIY